MICSYRFELVGLIILAVIIPEIFHRIIIFNGGWVVKIKFEYLDKSEILASIIALLAAHLSLQKLSSLPLVGDKIAIFPAFVISFLSVTAILGVVFSEFGRYHLVTAFSVGIIWYFLLSVVRSRVSHPRLAVVGGLHVDDELQEWNIDWVALNRARLPRDVAAIAFDKTHMLEARFERLFARAVLRQIPVYELGALREMLTGRVQLHLRPEEEFGAIFPSRPYHRIKRYLDLLTAILVLPLVAPLIILCALAVRIESPGPALFVQQRIGYRGHRFSCFKLRSMRTDLPGSDFTLEGDPRITTIGSFLRRTRIDELPQIFNILKGDMSWIGPRPEAVSLARLYEREIPYYGYRHLVRPGISGWAAVHQGNVALPAAAMRKLEYDFYYIKHFSLWLDFVTLLMTARTVLTGFGAR